jgi:glutathione peroxidase
MVEPTRRTLLAAAGGLALTGAAPARTAFDFSFPEIEGGRLDLSAFKGRVLLVANTASFCGYTYQYDALEKLHAARSAAGLTVIGVPSQDFDQESADNAIVKTFCETRFGIDFPLAALSHVRGAQAAPFYAWVKAQRGWEPAWNFNKVLIGRDGAILATFGATDEPDGQAVSGAVEAALRAGV